MLRSSALPWRSAFFIWVSQLPPEHVYQVLLLVVVLPARENDQPVLA